MTSSSLIYPLGKVIRVKNLRISINHRPKPRYLIYFGYVDALNLHLFFTTTTKLSFYTPGGTRSDIPTYNFDSHSCFPQSCCLDINGSYAFSINDLQKFTIEECCRLTEREFLNCLRAITYDRSKTNIDDICYKYLRNLLLQDFKKYW